MRGGSCRVGCGLVAVGVLLGGTLGAAEVQDAAGTSPVLALFPDAAQRPGPPWLKPGIRLTYYGAAANVPQGRYVFTRTAKGEAFWANERGRVQVAKDASFDEQGRPYKRADMPSSPGHGYNQVNVVAVSEKAVAIEVRTYSFLNYTGPLKVLSVNSFVGLPAAGGDFWVHPGLLAGLAERKKPDITVRRLSFKLDGHVYKAVAIRRRGAMAEAEHVYDLATGMLLHSHSKTTQGPSNPPPHYPIGSVARPGQTLLTHCYLKAIRPLHVPWADAPPPAWIREVTALDYTGTYRGAAPGLMPVTMPAALHYRVLRRGEGWLQYRQRTEFGAPPVVNRSEFLRVAGAAQFGGMWIPPQAAEGLREGQVLDRDPLTRVTVSVVRVGPTPQGVEVVHIAEAGPVHRVDYAYDATTGRLIGYGETDEAMHVKIAFDLAEAR